MAPWYQQRLAFFFFFFWCIKFTEWRFDTYGMVFARTLIWYHTHTDKHTWQTRTSKLTHTHKYILTASAICTQQLPSLDSINDLLIQKFTLQRSIMHLHFKYFSLVGVICLQIRFNKINFFLWNTKNAHRNGENEQNTPHTERKITLERAS